MIDNDLSKTPSDLIFWIVCGLLLSSVETDSYYEDEELDTFYRCLRWTCGLLS